MSTMIPPIHAKSSQPANSRFFETARLASAQAHILDPFITNEESGTETIQRVLIDITQRQTGTGLISFHPDWMRVKVEAPEDDLDDFAVIPAKQSVTVTITVDSSGPGVFVPYADED